MSRLLAVLLFFSVPAFAGAAPEPTISIADLVVTEGSSTLSFFQYIDVTVTLSHATTQNVSVEWDVEYGTAAGDDIGTLSGTVTIPAGRTSGTLSILINPDLRPEPDEIFFVNLSNPVNATIADGRAQVTLLNGGDVLPTINIDEAVYPLEGNAGTARVILHASTSPRYTSPVTFTYTTEDDTATAGEDYIAASGTLTIPALVLGWTFELDLVLGDTITEERERFYLNLTSTDGIVRSRIQVLIVDDDQPADLSITKNGPATALPGSQITYTLTASNAGPRDALNVSVTDALPAGTTLVSATPALGTCGGTTIVTCNLGRLNMGASANITLIVTAPSLPQTISNTATITPLVSDPTPANNTSAAAITAVVTAPAQTAPIPTLSEWALLALLAGLVATAVLKLR